MQEQKIDDYWNVDSCKHLSDSWRGFTKFTLLKDKHPKGYRWSRVRLTKIQTTTRSDYVWPEVWTKIGKAVQNREKQEWAKEKPKLDNARKLTGFYFIDPDDKEHSEIIKKRKKKTGKTNGSSYALQARQTAFQHRENEGRAENAHEKEFKTMYGCMVECHESIFAIQST